MKYRVVTTPVFWECLEAALPAHTEPNWHQFASLDLGDIIKHFGDHWDDLPPSVLPEHRSTIGAGRVASWVVTGRWSTAHRKPEIELVDISVQVWPPEMFEPSVDS